LVRSNISIGVKLFEKMKKYIVGKKSFLGRKASFLGNKKSFI